MINGYDYYISVNADNEVTDSFTTAHKQPSEDDVLLKSGMSESCWSLQITKMVDGLMVYQYVRDEQVPEGYREKTDEEIQTPEFIAEVERTQTLRELAQTDINMPRPLEDVIDVLIAKNTFKKGDFPASVQELHTKKKELRSKI